MLLGPDLLSAVLGWDCHTHRCYGMQKDFQGPGRISLMQKR